MLADEEIFLAARQLTEPAEQVAFLDLACAGDSALRATIEGMLRDAGEADAYFQTPAVTATIPAAPDAGHTVLGRYKLLEKIGEGGMGIVYMAEQREPVVRKVALKIIKAGMDTRQVIARFEAERQALALMDHPNIARVLDGGTTEQGRPYFVMDLVQGLPITQFCDEGKLSTHERLALFLEVCAAVQHAHQKGIIHRDLKPSNILVTLHGDQPVPKVIDFGIAKATQQRLTDKTLFTQFQHFLGTPAYMSPEQASLSGLDIDTRSDLYSLGVLLYELLTSKTPFDGNELLQSGLDEMRRTIREREPVRPSNRVSVLEHKELTTVAARRRLEVPGLIHALRGDLDWIAMKCLEKDRNRRYETAIELAADLNRHLNNEPVLARPPSVGYRIQKLAQRNKVAFTAAAAITIVLMLASLVSIWQAVRATGAERKAQAEAERANQESAMARSVRDFLIQQVLDLNPQMEEAPDPNRRALIARIDRAIGAQFTNQPLVEAELRYALGDAYSGVGDRIGMIRQLERALEIRRRELGLTNSETLQALASTAEEYYKVDRKDENERLLREGMAVVRASPHPLSAGAAEVLTARSQQRFFEGDPAEACSLLQEAIAVARRSADPMSWRFQNKLMWLARYTGAAGRTNEAAAMFAEQVLFREREYGANHPMTAALIEIQAEFFAHVGRTNEAIAALERVLPIARRSLDPKQDDISLVEQQLAQLYETGGRIEDAAALYRSFLPRWTSSPALSRHRRRGVIWAADFFVRHRDYPHATSVYDSMRVGFESIPPGDVTEAVDFIRATAATQGWPAAAALCRQHFDAFPDSLWMWLNKAWVFRFTGDEASYHRIVAIGLTALSVVTTDELHVLIEILALNSFPLSTAQVEQIDQAMSTLEIALPGRSTELQTYGYRAIGLMQLRLGRFDRCLAALDQAASHQANPEAYPLFIRAIAQHRLGRPQEARAAFEQAEATMKAQLGEPFSEAEKFLPVWQIYQHVLMHRESRALLGLNE